MTTHVSTWRVDRRSLVLRALAIFLYCYGAILAPTLHQAFHHSDHIHLGDSIVYIADHDDHDDDHDHADHDHHHHHAGDHDHADDHDDDHDAPHHHDDHEHGLPSLWHFGAALGENANRVPAVTADRALVWIAGAPRAERPRTIPVRTARLRGPPSVSPACL
jgi:hypothetical protein